MKSSCLLCKNNKCASQQPYFRVDCKNFKPNFTEKGQALRKENYDCYEREDNESAIQRNY